MKRYADKLFIIGLSSFIILYFISTIWNEGPFLEALSFLGFLILVSAFLVLPKRNLILPLLLITVSVTIVVLSSSSPIVLWIGFREMRSIIPLIILIGLVSWMIGHRPYVKALMRVGGKKITTPSRFYSFIMGLTHFISSFMTVGGIAFVYQLFHQTKKPSVPLFSWDFTMSTAIMRGFTLTVLWTVVHPAFAYGIVGTNAPLLPTMIKGLGLAIIGMFISLFIFQIQSKQKKISVDVTPDFSTKTDEKLDGLIKEFIFWLVLLLTGILVSNQLFNVDVLLAIPVVIVFVTFLYFIVKKEWKTYQLHWKTFLTVDLGNKKKELFLILSAGLLVGTLKETGYAEVLFELFLVSVEFLNVNILIGLTFMIILLGVCGFPPIPAMVLLSSILVNIPGGYSPDLVALSLLLGVSVTLVIAPVTIPLLILSSLNGRSLVEIGFRWNFIFGICFLLVGLIYIQLIAFL